jgi:ApbE superfamily uncharacterized protein (UPF0280 family)
MQGPQAHWLSDGKRLHLNHGPIDLIVEAFGERHEVEAAYAQAVARFQTILSELVAELPLLRRAVVPAPALSTFTPTPNPSPLRGGGLALRLRGQSRQLKDAASEVAAAPKSRSPLRGGGTEQTNIDRTGSLSGPTARRMYTAVLPHAETFITPMAAVAGSVADEIMAALLVRRSINKAYVNNGGDIALHLTPGEELNIAVAGTGHGFSDRVVVRPDDQVRGIATSGWRGRSFSLGIADAVTVLARTGAEADAAATVVANAIDLPDHAAVSRRPANELAPESDLGGRMVTVGVGALTHSEVTEALAAGLFVAEDLRRRGLIEAAALFLAGENLVCGGLTLPLGGGSARSVGVGVKENFLCPDPALRTPLSLHSFVDPPHKGEGKGRCPPTHHITKGIPACLSSPSAR